MSNLVKSGVGPIISPIEELDMLVHVNMIVQFHDVLRWMLCRRHFGDQDGLVLS